jgi:4-amino-4-deoxy-L-arabinose transferase-like glycosyltransferase
LLPSKDNPGRCQPSLQGLDDALSAATQPDASNKISNLLLTAAVLGGILQVLWFAPKCFNQIDFDGMAYTGIARHLRQGEFHSAINAFRSPLISWLIAGASFVTGDYLHAGKLVTIGSFLVCLPLLYIFALRLWNSRLVAALAVLLFTLGRGLSVEAVASVTPDFLFAALVLVYFLVLLRCLRAGSLRAGSLKDWFFLGIVHGLAFLAKAFALPWLGVCTVIAVLLSDKPWKTRATRLVLAALIPVMVAAGWATVLHSKYGVYTVGSQFKANLLQWTLHEYPAHRETNYTLLRDTTSELDEYVIDDPMPPGSWPWTYHVAAKQAFPKMILAEEHNVPLMLKELAVVLTPGVLMAFIATFAILSGKRHLYPLEWRVSAVIAASALSLVFAYSMLAFDARYLYPLIPLVLAVGARFLVADVHLNHNGWRRISLALVVLGVIASLVYPSSPFRLLTRDFQVASYHAGALLRRQPGRSRLVSIGSGPFPEHGVGWEAGYQAAYFGGSRLIAATDTLPGPAEMGLLTADLNKAAPDAIAVWGRPGDSRYTDFVSGLVSQYPNRPPEKISDPVLGEVGVIFNTAP